jgi:hypothetical protein
MMVMMVVGVLSLTLGFDEESCRETVSFPSTSESEIIENNKE